MKAIAVWFMSYILAICFPGNPKHLEKVTFDIIHVHSSSINTYTRRPYGIVTKVHSPKNDVSIVAIVDGQETLWTCDHNHSCDHVVVIFGKRGTPVSVLVYTRNVKGVQSCLYLERLDSEWVSVTEEEFYKRIHTKMEKGVLFDSIDIDINKKEGCGKRYVTNSPKLPFLVFAPNVGYRIKKVKDGLITTLWTAKSEHEECTYISLYPRDAPTWAYLLVSERNFTRKLFLRKVGNVWKPASRDVYLTGLNESGFNLEKLDDRAILDVQNPDEDKFRKHTYILSECFEHLYRPLPGYLFTKIVENGVTIWEASNGEHCLYAGIAVKEILPIACYLFVVDANNNKKILYHINDGSGWKSVEKDAYFNSITDGNNPAYTHKADKPKLVMGSFKNKQGLRIATYASTVDGAKADIILIHGFRAHFKADFIKYNYEWNFEHLGYPSSPNARKLFVDDEGDLHKNPSFAHRYKHMFEYADQSAFNAFEMTNKFENDIGFMASANRLGYNVYGFDLQSQGLSEAQTDKKCHVNDFTDHVHDVMQFVSIVKRGAFNDPSQTWDEMTIYGANAADSKTFLLGYSMGGNIVIQAVQEFYRVAGPDTPLVDGIIITSGMFNLNNHLNTLTKKIAKKALKLLRLLVPLGTSHYEFLPDYGESFDMFTRFNDPFFHAGWTVIKTISDLVNACTDVNREDRMAHYPKDLPTLLIHTRDDFMCHVKGPRDIMNNYFKDSEVVKLIELKGSCHYLTAAQAAPSILLSLNGWLHSTPKITSTSKGVNIPSDEL